MNVFGENKRDLSDRLYSILDDKTGDMLAICNMNTFAECFQEVLKDYVLVPKTTIIEE